MPVTPLATQADVAERLGSALTQAQLTRVDGLLAEASDLVVGHLGEDPTVDGVVPAEVARVVSRMVARVLEQDVSHPGVESMTDSAGPFAQTRRFTPGATAGGPWLAASDKVALRPFRSGMASIPISSGRTGQYRRL